MFAYHLRLAWRSLRRNPVLSLLLVGGIAVGIAVASTFVSLSHVVNGDPIPGKSDRLFYVRLDSWSGANPWDVDDPTMPPDQIGYRDLQSLIASEIPTYRTGSFKADLTVHPEGASERPFLEVVRMTYADFFPMFGIPFLYGSGWDREADQGPDPVVVIDQAMNQRLFGGGDSVGRTLRIEDSLFTVVGVMDHWRPTPKFYDPLNDPFEDAEAIYMPFDFMRQLQILSAGNISCWDQCPFEDFDAHLNASNAIWIQFWAQLDSDEQRDAFQGFVDAYVTEQKAIGRFPRPLNNRLQPVMEFLQAQQVVPEETHGVLVIALLFLGICAVNLIGILLGKFLSRAPEVGIRRALGASRRSVFVQHLVECELVALIGGTIGIALGHAGVGVVGKLFQTGTEYPLDAFLVASGIGLALAAGLIAGLYPSWRICRVPPAAYLKLQ